MTTAEEEQLRNSYREASAEGVSRSMTWLEFSMSFALGSDHNDYFKLAALDTLETAVVDTARNTIEANNSFLRDFKTQFGNLDRGMVFYGYERLAIEGRLPWYEIRDMLGLHWIEARLDATDDDPFPLLSAAVTQLNFCLAGPARWGVDGLLFEEKLLRLLLPFLNPAVLKWEATDSARSRLRDYFSYFADTLFDMPRMFQYERVHALGRIIPAFEPETSRAWLPSRPLVEVFPSLRDQPRYWLFQEADSILNLYRIQSAEPLNRRLRRFKDTDKIRGKNSNVNTWVKSQTFVAIYAESAKAKLRLLAQLLDCQRFRAAKGRWPSSGKELSAAGLNLYMDPFTDSDSLNISGTKDNLLIYSCGRNMKDDQGKADDIAIRIENGILK